MRKKSIVNVAVVGAGAIAHQHIQGFQKHRSARVVAIAEVDPERGRDAAQRFDVPLLVSDYRELLRRPEIDLVSIALPNYLHAPATIDALRAGKHVMLDKPMATSARDAARMIAAAKRARRHFMVGQNQRFTGAVQALRKLIADGKLGDLYHARGVWQRRRGIPRIGSWFTQRRYAGGGCTYDLGVHILDLALHLLDDFEPAAVTGCMFAKFGPRGRAEFNWGLSPIDPGRPFDVEDFSVALIKMKSGRTVQLDIAWAASIEHADVNGVHVFGTEGGATTNPPRYFRRGRGGHSTTEITPRAHYAPENRMAHFIDVVLGAAPSYVPLEQSLVVQRILDAIYKSAQLGREVRL